MVVFYSGGFFAFGFILFVLYSVWVGTPCACLFLLYLSLAFSKKKKMGRVKTRKMGMGLGMGKYPQKIMGMSAGMGTIVPTQPHTRTHILLLNYYYY